MVEPKYYSWHSTKKCYVIEKRINNRKHFFGYYKTEEQVKLAVELFNKYGWNKENNWRVKAEVREKIGDVL